ncbi:DEAD/H associated domain protein [Xylanimonas cellulosilytica DSM 15894]|uniref:DEAD/H associated domain protein n=1 Tax=Xylanimonas cellulosilytica (strain DSM 15894 / JCM 12276 / CECT 5975 / KCTC 9989 / LMG 20990 / NBRC 107835 / XIL07) TaxID=446471 RepID=D1C082_XYLCX|nr:ATP-dependent helicase [Xylanimonas cellulosilytica]ACZ30271.1 DEAD/H associated domain protein [Xylanimonas cellulosilytica DSM 15894]
MTSPLDRLGPATRDWFAGAFEGPTAAQDGAWDAIGQCKHALVVAPTGSGKTLAAFLWAIDRLHHEPVPERARRCRVLYVSPLKALAADVQRNLRSPLTGIRQAAARAGIETPEIAVGMRTGDTPPSERRSFATRPPDVLVTTPESLFLVLTSQARAGLLGVETVILDEIHAVAGTKRGAHLALSLERLDALLVASGSRPAQRVGLSATVRPVEVVAQFLGGHRTADDGGREVVVVQPPATKRWAIDVVVPVPDLADLDAVGQPGGSDDDAGPGAPDLTGDAASPLRRASVWPHVEERVVDLVAGHRSTLVFTNSRRGAERLTSRMNELWSQRLGEAVDDQGATWPAAAPGQSGTAVGRSPDAEVLARAHHGSMSRAERTRTESELKEGRLPAVVATSSLELGIDMGAVDLVVQVGAPPSVASGLQRIGRAGHQVGAVSHGVVFPTHRGDLVPAAVVAQRMRAGEIEPLHVPANPLDVLAQQVVAALATDDWDAAELLATFRRAHPYAHLGDATWNAVLDMLAGRYPSEDFAELRARIVWDRATDRLSGRPGALRLAATSGGTIPDRGLYGVYLAGSEEGAQRGGKRVGELDEEMVYESRVGDTFTLGSSTWRIEDITPDRVLVSPAPGLPGRLPFWKGDAQGRPVELGRAMGAFVRTIDTELAAGPDGADAGRARLREAGLDAWAADNLAAYLTEQRTATGRLPDDRTIVVERFRDELGDWRVVVHSPFGARVHAPWSLVLAGRLRARYGLDVAVMHSDDGIVLRLPDSGAGWDDLGAAPTWADGGPGGAGSDAPIVTAEDLLVDPDDVVGAVRDELGSSVLFAARFREASARALLLPRRRPDRRQPLWQQRQRAAQLLQVAAQFPDFPMTLEAARECLQDDFDVAALAALMGDLGAGRVRIVEVATQTPSPFAQSLLFGYTAQFLYDGDAPLAERRAAALSLDPDLLAELLGDQGATAIADLLDPAAVERTESELQALAPDRQAKDAEGLWDVLRRTGPHPLAALEARTREEARGQVPDWLAELERARRLIRVRFAGAEQWAVVEDAGRLRDALGVALPVGVPETLTELVPDALGDLVRRHVRTHGPVAAADVAARYGLGVAVVLHALARLQAAGTVVRGALRPSSLGGTGDEWCDPEVLRTLRRRSLAALRAEVEPVEPQALGVFLPRWQQVGSPAAPRGVDGVLRAVEQLAGAAVPASALETLVLPARVPGYSPALLDELTTAGEVLWCGHARLPGSGGGDGMVSLHLADGAALTLRPPDPVEPGGPLDTPLHRAVLDLLTGSGGFFLPRLAELAGTSASATVDVLWDLVWAGRVTNDGLGPLREAVGTGAGGAHRAPRAPARARPVSRTRFGGLGRPASSGSPVSAAAVVRTGGGRWSALPDVERDPTIRAHALTQVLLERHGVLTRAVAPSEGAAGAFRDVYRVLRELEERGAVRRGYFVEGLGGSQFALPGAVDQLRTDAADRSRAHESDDDVARPASAPGRGSTRPGGDTRPPEALLLAATDPANPYGAALAWPRTGGASSVHRPGRKAGAVVVLVDGDLVLYVERGGRTVLSFAPPGPGGARRTGAAARELAAAASSGRLGRVLIQRVDGVPALTAARDRTPAAAALLDAGFAVTPRGLRVAGG